MTDRITALLDWCHEHDIFIDSRLAIVQNNTTGSVGVYNSSDVPIEAPTTLVKIPKRAILSARSCSLAEAIPYVPYGPEAHLGLSLAVYSELLRGTESRWSGYLQALPQSAVDIALLWGSDQLPPGRDQGHREDREDARQARAWAAGTELGTELRPDGVNSVPDELREYYASVALPTLSSHIHRNSITFSGFLHAYSLVSSRAFLVDAYHGLSMVPVADAFNHTQDNHVHLESDFDVCVTCGSFAPCPHDEDNTDSGQNSSVRPSDATEVASANSPRRPVNDSPGGVGITNPQGILRKIPASITCLSARDATVVGHSGGAETETCDMVSNLPIPPHSEIFNTYGEHLSNAQLLARYGFMLEENDNDIVQFELEDVHAMWASPIEGGTVEAAHWLSQLDWNGFFSILGDVVHIWPRYARWVESSLVYQPDHDATSPTSTQSQFHAADISCKVADDAKADYRAAPLRMCVNSDAKISHALWVCSALLACSLVPTSDPLIANMERGTGETVAVLVRLAERQLFWEGLSETNAHEARSADADDDEGTAQPAEKQASPSTLSGDDKILDALAGVVAWACTQSTRAKRLGRPPYGDEVLSTEEIGDRLDALPAGMRRTRAALLLVLSERSVLESCGYAWEDLRGVLATSSSLSS